MSGFGWPDLVVVALILLSAFAATRRGFVAVILSLLGFIVALVLSFGFYPGAATFLSSKFGWSPVWAKPLAFIGIWLITELILGVAEGVFVARSAKNLEGNVLNRSLAVLPGVLQGLLLSAVVLTLLALAPVNSNLRNDIFKGPLSSKVVATTLSWERPLEGVFGPAAREALGFLTVKPPTSPGSPGSAESEKPVALDFTVANAQAESQTEEAMLELLNKERSSRGLVVLVWDAALQKAARAHADDMFKRGYFAHDTPEGLDPFERMQKANISFHLAGENLALAPTLDIAHTGLMNSPGHRANILNGGFRKAGIGVLDGGLYGKMFVQEFTD
ncbi:MAG: CvpA family protein [Chloroflexota bacterium]|nr:CvpA family protein [Chloroflexota bacterium]